MITILPYNHYDWVGVHLKDRICGTSTGRNVMYCLSQSLPGVGGCKRNRVFSPHCLLGQCDLMVQQIGPLGIQAICGVPSQDSVREALRNSHNLFAAAAVTDSNLKINGSRVGLQFVSASSILFQRSYQLHLRLG